MKKIIVDEDEYGVLYFSVLDRPVYSYDTVCDVSEEDISTIEDAFDRYERAQELLREIMKRRGSPSIKPEPKIWEAADTGFVDLETRRKK